MTSAGSGEESFEPGPRKLDVEGDDVGGDIAPATDLDDAQTYFEELAMVKDSILEGVITYW
ncbi:hypothetical protein [Streptomyces cavernae]|uniref:hypothetical protein n=1 Tax=Streptomyces cavernae TaxID=2259034 RepID=UPI000FEBE8D2|nr:hypothetical protein [Streptomyces cavernae]